MNYKKKRSRGIVLKKQNVLQNFAKFTENVKNKKNKNKQTKNDE